jgi:hypothetical protein
LSLDKIRSWVQTSGRVDVTQGRSERELAVLQRISRIALDLDGVVLHQGAKAGKGGEQHDLDFARRMPERKTPIVFCGVIFKPAQGAPFFRRNDIKEPDTVRLYLRTTEAASKASAWGERFVNDDGLKSDPEWRYVDIPPSLEITGDELLDLIEDAYYQVAGI